MAGVTKAEGPGLDGPALSRAPSPASLLLKMRRSAAPSQVRGNSSKKARFVPPGRSTTGVSKEISMSPEAKLVQVN